MIDINGRSEFYNVITDWEGNNQNKGHYKILIINLRIFLQAMYVEARCAVSFTNL